VQAAAAVGAAVGVVAARRSRSRAAKRPVVLRDTAAELMAAQQRRC
jgi:hypothetical protein